MDFKVLNKFVVIYCKLLSHDITKFFNFKLVGKWNDNIAKKICYLFELHKYVFQPSYAIMSVKIIVVFLLNYYLII